MPAGWQRNEDDSCRDEAVDRETVGAREVADAAAEGEAADAGRADDAGGNGPAVLLRGRIDLAELRTAADTHHARGRIHDDAVHRREVDDEPVVDAPESGAVVPTAANGDAE